MNTALMTAPSGIGFDQARQDRDYWGHLVESAVGAHLINSTRGTSAEIFYWREGNKEVDFIVRSGRMTVAVEVKTGYAKEVLPGMEALSKRFRIQRKLVVGGQGIKVEEYLLKTVEEWLR